MHCGGSAVALPIVHPPFTSTTKAPTTYLNLLFRWSIILSTTMTLLSQSYDEDKVFFNCHPKGLTLWQTFLFSLWSLLVFAHSICVFTLKLCELLQTLTSTWLAQSLKEFQDLNPLKLAFHEHSPTLEPIDHGLKPPKTPELVKLKVQEILCESHGLLLPPTMDDFVVKHIFNQLLVDPSML